MKTAVEPTQARTPVPANTTQEEIHVQLVETNVFTRWYCDACGGNTDKVPILAEVPGDDAGDPLFRVCERCLLLGDIDERMEQQALRLESEALWLRQFIGRLVVPTYEEWEAACDRYVERWILDGYGTDAPPPSPEPTDSTEDIP